MMRRIWTGWRRQEEGQVMVILALALAILLGFAALAIDIGMFMWEKRALQNAADAAALAGALELPPSPTEAVEAAREYALRNGVGANGWTLESIEVTEDATSIAVVVAHPQSPFMLARVLGLLGVDVRARAQAAVSSPQRINNVMPWALKKSVYDATSDGGVVILKYDARDPDQGNFGPLAIDGQGASTYRRNIIQGATVELGRKYPTETGNMVGPTREGLQSRLASTSQNCDQWEEVFEHTGSSWRLKGQCNPWLGMEGSKRVVVVPLIDDEDLRGRTEVEVEGLALVFLEDFSCQGGNECQVRARLVRAMAALEGPDTLLGPYNPQVGIRTVRLAE